jgi:hypothetical protein
LEIIPSSGLSAKELSIISNSPSSKHEDLQSSEGKQNRFGKSRTSNASADQTITSITAQKMVHDDDINGDGQRSPLPSTATSKRTNEGTYRRLNLGKAAVMDSLMTVASDTTTSKISAVVTVNKDAKDMGADKLTSVEK